MAVGHDFTAFYEGTRDRVLASVYALTGDLAEAQDITQEAYARAWQRWRRLRGYDVPEAWVRTVARNIARSGWRKARNRITAYRRHGAAPPAPPPSENQVALLAALQELPAAQREAVVLHHLVGMSVAEISRQTDTPEGTVKARLARGRKALAELLRVDISEVSRG
ncbi:MAG: RNA polymerase sigma factor [Micromonosporaceae bacterium]